ncbi:hypothetical protein SAMN05519103_09051 [Rhizobiales bacterium GAS113]|nr:hypothetical protein SAMN05519103_09051 [Rhizobiales bacterium GAS113]
MSDDRSRMPLPRSSFKLASTKDKASGETPTVITPDYGENLMTPAAPASGPPAPRVASPPPLADRRLRDPFDPYGDRTASRPFALRLPAPIDLVLRQIAAEHHTQPLRIVDQAIHDYLVKLGRLPGPPDA